MMPIAEALSGMTRDVNEWITRAGARKESLWKTLLSMSLSSQSDFDLLAKRLKPLTRICFAIKKLIIASIMTTVKPEKSANKLAISSDSPMEISHSLILLSIALNIIGFGLIGGSVFNHVKKGDHFSSFLIAWLYLDLISVNLLVMSASS